jgi:hypothetical protein
VQWVITYKSNEISCAYGNIYSVLICAQQEGYDNQAYKNQMMMATNICIHKGAM